MFKFVLYGNVIFDTLEQSSFQKYATCWVFLALCHMLYLCICVFVYVYFVFACLTHGNIIFDILEQSSFQKYATCWVFLALPHMLYCVFVYFVFVFVFVFVLVITVWQKTSSSLRQYFIWQVWVGPWMIYKALEVIQIFLAGGRTDGRTKVFQEKSC